MNTEKQSFEKYAEMYKPWQDMLFNWPKSMCSMSSLPAGADIWFKPYSSCFGDWNGLQDQFTKAFSAFFQPLNASQISNQAIFEGFGEYIKIVEAWYKNADKIGKMQCELIQGLFTGKEVNIAESLENIKVSYDDFSKNFIESLKKTPLEKTCQSLEELNNLVKKIAESFPEEQKQAKEILQTLWDSYHKIISPCY